MMCTTLSFVNKHLVDFLNQNEFSNAWQNDTVIGGNNVVFSLVFSYLAPYLHP